MFVLLFAAIKVAGQTTGYLRFDTVRIMKQGGTCELYIINKTKDSLGLLTNVGGGLTQFKKSMALNDSMVVIGNDTITIRGTGGGGTPGSPEYGVQYRDPTGIFKADSFFLFPAQKRLLLPNYSIQYGRPGIGYWQDSTWLNTTGLRWIAYPRGSNGTPGQTIDPGWGADTLQPFYSQIATALYDVTKPENPVIDIVKFGNTGSYRPMARLSLEQKFYNFIEFHFATKPHLMNPNDEIRHWSWTISDQNGAANLTTRSSDNRWGFPIVNSPNYDKEYAVLDAQKFELKAISNPSAISLYGGALQDRSLKMIIDTGISQAMLDAAGVGSLILGSQSNNEIVIQNPGTSSGLILANKSFVVAGKQLQVGGLANSALGLSVTSGAQGYIWQTNTDANGYARAYCNGTIEINRDPLGFDAGDRMFFIYNNFNPNDSIFRVGSLGNLWTKGQIKTNSLKTTLTAPATEGITKMVITDTNGLLSYADIPGGGSSYTFSNGLTESAGTAKLGGALTELTTITSSVSGRNINYTGISDYIDGPQLNVVNSGSAGIAIHGESTDGRGVEGVATSGIGVYGIASTGYGSFNLATSGNAIFAQSDEGMLLEGFISPASTNTTSTWASFTRGSTGTPVNGMGGTFDYYLKSSTGVNRFAANMGIAWEDATDATRSSTIYWNNTYGTVLSLKGNGQIQHGAYGSGANTVTPATTPVYSSTGVIGERIAPKIYTALLSQSGTGAPTATILGTNEIGSIVWTRNSTGNFTGTLTGAFTSNKTWAVCQKGDMGGSFVNGLLSSSSANTVLLTVTDNAGSSTDNFTNMSIEIRVYP
jgi:hypothetical protein